MNNEEKKLRCRKAPITFDGKHFSGCKVYSRRNVYLCEDCSFAYEDNNE